MKKLTAVPACAAALLLASCTYSNIGSCIRNSGLTHTGVDVRTPVDGKMYQTPNQRKTREAYVRAPELRYRLNHPLFISYNIKGDHNEPEPFDIRPTGQVRLALADTSSAAIPWRFRKSAIRHNRCRRPRILPTRNTPEPPRPLPAGIGGKLRNLDESPELHS